MQILIRTLIEILKTFALSIACSVVFALMIYSDLAMGDAFVCFVLNSAALVFFLYFLHAGWLKLYDDSNSKICYYIPTLVSTVLYCIVSAIAYKYRFSMYMWTFLPTRFLEPRLNIDYAFISVLLTDLLIFSIVFVTPVIFERKRHKHYQM